MKKHYLLTLALFALLEQTSFAGYFNNGNQQATLLSNTERNDLVSICGGSQGVGGSAAQTGACITLTGDQSSDVSTYAVYSGTTLLQKGNSKGLHPVNGNSYLVVNDGAPGASPSIDWSVGSYHQIEVTTSPTFTFTAPLAGTSYGQMLTLLIYVGAPGGYTYTWPANVKWAAGSAPSGSATGKYELLQFWYDGVYYYGIKNLNY